MIYGTSYFSTLSSAYAYYTAHALGYTRTDVDYKIQQGEIHIGAPEVKPGEKLLIDPQGRYFIDDGKE